MARTSKVRGPSPSKRKDSSALPDSQQRLTLTMTEEDVQRLQRIADANIRSMSAQALYYIRTGMQREIREMEPGPG